MNQENLMLSKNQDKSYNIVDQYLNHNIFYGYKFSDNYHDIDVDEILLFVKGDNEYTIRYNDVNKMRIVPLELIIKNFSFGELHMFTSSITMVPIHSDDKEFLENVQKYGIRLLN